MLSQISEAFRNTKNYQSAPLRPTIGRHKNILLQKILSIRFAPSQGGGHRLTP